MLVYVLQLADGCWYVGRVKTASDLDARVAQHRAKEGAQWTQLHAVQAQPLTVADAGPTEEDAQVLRLMAEHGIDKVRGGTFCTPTLADDDRRVLERMMDSARGSCYHCRAVGHCANECPLSLDMAARRGGDWECPDCGNNVFARNAKCPKCGKWKPTDAKAATVPPAGWKPGDWKCPECGDHVFAKKTACGKCSAARPAGPGKRTIDATASAVAPTADKTQPRVEPLFSLPQFQAQPEKKAKHDTDAPVVPVVLSGDWTCTACQFNNYASRQQCHKCHKARPRPDAEAVADCVVCLSKPVKVAAQPCGHLCMCEDCAPSVTDACPMCRQPLAAKLTVYQ